MTTSPKDSSAGEMSSHEQQSSPGADTAGKTDESTSTLTTSCRGSDVIVTYEQVVAVMQLYVAQGSDADEMKRRAALLKLEAATAVAAFKILDELGLKPDGHELAELEDLEAL